MGYRLRVVCAEATCCRGGDYTDGIFVPLYKKYVKHGGSK